jgi:hypothetical protein
VQVLSPILIRFAPLALFLTACGGPAPAPAPPEPPAHAAFREALGQVHLAAGRLRGALALRAERAAAATHAPTPDNCRRVQEAAELLDRHREGLREAYADLAARAAPWPDRARSAQDAAAALAASAAADADWAAAWRDRCAGLPPVVDLADLPPVQPRALCPDLVARGPLLTLTGPEWPDRALRPAGGLAVARRLSRDLEDDFDVIFVIVHDRNPPDGGHRESVYLDRGTPGLGLPAPTPPEALPRWHRLRSVVVLGGEAGLRRGPSLRGLLLAYADRLSLPGCSPGPGAGWGWSDVGGQLGGAASLTEIAPGRWRAAGPGRGPFGLVANGGNVVPYAPLELYLMGLAPLADVRPVTFLRDARPAADGTIEAAGACRLDAKTLASRFGERPLDPAPWNVGVVVVAAAPPDEATLDRHRADAVAFTADGPDDDPTVLDFHEATGGRGRLVLTAPRLHAGATCRDEP